MRWTGERTANPPGRIGRISRLLPARIGAAIIAGALGLPASAVAQNTADQHARDFTSLSLEQLLDVDVVYSASKREQTTLQAPSAVTVVTADEIRRHGFRTLADVLRSLQSFYVTDDRNYSYVGVRGFGRPGDYNTRVLLLLDGLRVNDNVYDMAYVGLTFPVNIDLVERIEIVRGPGAALYGNSAFFAVINVVTKAGARIDGAELAGAAGSFGARRARATFGRRLASGLDVVVSGSYSASTGQDLYFPEYDEPQTEHGVARGVDGEDAGSVLATVRKAGFSLHSSWVSRGKAIPTGSFGTIFGDTRNRTRDERTMVGAAWDGALGPRLDQTVRVHYDRYSYRGGYAYDAPAGLNDDRAWGEWWGVEWQASSRGQGPHKFGFGGEFQDNLRQAQRNVTGRETFVDVMAASRQWGVYAQDALTLKPWLTAQFGARYDHYDTFGSSTSPRLALIFSPARDTALKLLYGRAFRAPNEFELHYVGPGQEANPRLRPESIQTYEVVAEQRIGRRLRMSASGFFNRIGGLIDLSSNANGDLQYQNLRNLNSRGLEVAVEAHDVGPVSGRASWSFQRSDEGSGGADLTNSPRHMVKLAAHAPLFGDRLSAGVDWQYMSSRRTLAGGLVRGFTVANVTLLGRIRRGLEASVSVYNLLDARYSDPGSEEHRQDSIEQDGRSLRIKLTWCAR